MYTLFFYNMYLFLEKISINNPWQRNQQIVTLYVLSRSPGSIREPSGTLPNGRVEYWSPRRSYYIYWKYNE